MSCTVEVWRQVITLIWEEERGWDRLWFEGGGVTLQCLLREFCSLYSKIKHFLGAISLKKITIFSEFSFHILCLWICGMVQLQVLCSCFCQQS